MNNKHLSTDELLDFIYMDKDSFDIKKVAEINKHLYECSECNAKYQQLYDLKVGVEEAANSYMEKSFSLESVENKSKRYEADLLQRYKEYLIEELKLVKPKIKLSLSRVLGVSPVFAANAFSFVHPMALSAELKAFGSDKDDSQEENKTILSDENKHITFALDDDGTFSVYVDKDFAQDIEILYLLEDESDNYFSAELEEYDESRLVAVFDNVDFDSKKVYSVIFENEMDDELEE